MKVSCPSCEAKYNIADEKIKGKKVKVRCKSCGTQILVDGNSSQVSAVGTHDGLSEPPVQAASNSPAAPDPEPSNTWTVNFADNDERSLTAEEIADMAVLGQLSNEVFVWKDGMSDWQLVNDVPELASAIAAAKRRAASTSPANTAHKPDAASTTARETGAPAGENKASEGPNSNLPPAGAAGASIGPIVAAPGSALAKKMASAKNAAAQKKSGKADVSKQDALDVAAESPEAPSPKKPPTEPPSAHKPAPEHARVAKAATKRQAGTHDLFAAVDTAGSEVDVDTSEAESHDAGTKATGARNENSVLFSLDALKSGMLGDVAPAAAASNQRSPTGPRKKAPGAPAKRLEDLMSVDVMSGAGLGRGGSLGGGGLLLSGNDALLAAPPPPPPKPEPKPEPVVQASGGLGGSVAAPPKKRVGLFIGLAIALVAVGAGGAFVALKASSKDVAPVVSAAISTGAPVALSATAAPSAAPSAATAAKDEGPDASVPSTGSSATAPQAVAVASKYTGGGKASPVTGKTPAETKPGEKKPETKSAEPAAPSGAGGFNKDAAVSALSVAASQATVCKRPEGPWGTGRAVITFASSGRVTTANVTGDPFGGTAVGGCVASVFRRAKIPPFSGDPVTVSKSFTIAP